MIKNKFIIWLDQNLTSFETQIIFFYTVTDIIYICASILLFFIFRGLFYREYLIILLICKKNHWYNNLLFTFFLLTICIPNRVYVYNKVPGYITFFLYLLFLIFGYLETPFLWFFIITFFFLCLTSTLIGYSLEVKEGKINLFYTQAMFNGQHRLQKKFVELFFGGIPIILD